MIKPSNNHYMFLKKKRQKQYKNWYLSLLYLKLYIKTSDNGWFCIYNPKKNFPTDFENLFRLPNNKKKLIYKSKIKIVFHKLLSLLK